MNSNIANTNPTMSPLGQSLIKALELLYKQINIVIDVSSDFASSFLSGEYVKTEEDIKNDFVLSQITDIRSQITKIEDKFSQVIIEIKRSNGVAKPVDVNFFTKTEQNTINSFVQGVNLALSQLVVWENNYKKRSKHIFSTRVTLERCKQCWESCITVRDMIEEYNEVITSQYGGKVGLIEELKYPPKGK